MPVIDEAARGLRNRLSIDPGAFRRIAVAIGLLALGLRLVYFVGAKVDYPIRGDIIEYVNYAWNMVNHATFSSADPASGKWPPDAFRGPGYPAFLAFWMWISGGGRAGYLLAVFAQIVIGALLAPLAIVWSKRWLPSLAALAVGLLVALWPHAIVLSSTLLSETLFGVLLLILLLFADNSRQGHRGWAFAAGLAGGLAYLVNPVIALFPPLLSLALWFRKARRAAVLMLAVYALVVGGWASRNASHPEMPGAWDRAAVNLVEGSWPQYHDAYNERFRSPIAAKMMQEINHEEGLMIRQPRAGLRAMLGRMGEEPGYYLRWYLLQKPYSLWDWSIAVGWGDVYFLQTQQSPFERQVFYRLIHEAFRYANPVFFGLALLAILLGIRRAVDREFSLVCAISLFLYVTFVHTMLQAEPRYAVAYRPIESALAVTALLMAWRWMNSRGGSKQQADAAGDRRDGILASPPPSPVPDKQLAEVHISVQAKE